MVDGLLPISRTQVYDKEKEGGIRGNG